MNTRILYRAITVALVASMGLSGCGGGSGGGGQLIAPSTPPPTPTPPASDTGPCPMPVNGNCVVTTSERMLGGRSSEYALILRPSTPNPTLALGDSDSNVAASLRANIYTFASGTTIEGGGLEIHQNNTLVSNIRINAGALLVKGLVRGSVINHGVLEISTSIQGDVDNSGTTELWGSIVGNMLNSGTLSASGAVYGDAPTITGNLTQTSSGTLAFALAPSGWDSPAPLMLGGRADLAGTLQLQQYSDGWGPYPLAEIGSHHIVHANGGVFGTFDRWTSPGLFVEGGLRYGANDVWFDLNRVSVQAAMAGQGVGGITLASAGNLDRALAAADGFTTLPSHTLADSQRQFLSSASRIVYQQDWAQARHSLDSLAGREHPLLAQRLHQQGMATAAGIGMHVSGRRFDAATTQWSTSLAGTGQFHGFDRWLGPQWLVGGGYLQQGDGGLTSAFGSARSDDRLASTYLHYRGDAWQATAVANAARSNAQLQRHIDLGDARAHVAQSRPQLALLEVHGELARPRPWAGGSLQPYVALDYGAARSSRFLEGGDTGFELMSDGGRLQQFDGSVGARFMRGWRIGASRLELQADVRHARALQSSGHLPAAFAGVPDVRFDLGDWETPGASTSLEVGLQARTGNGWLWSLQANRASADPTGNGWLLALRKGL